jgi:hypothetical protein
MERVMIEKIMTGVLDAFLMFLFVGFISQIFDFFKVRDFCVVACFICIFANMIFSGLMTENKLSEGSDK